MEFSGRFLLNSSFLVQKNRRNSVFLSIIQFKFLFIMFMELLRLCNAVPQSLDPTNWTMKVPNYEFLKDWLCLTHINLYEVFM